MNGTLAPHNYLDRLEAFQKSDRDRYEMVEELVRKYSELQTQ